MSDLFGNHIVGFITRRLKYREKLYLSLLAPSVSMRVSQLFKITGLYEFQLIN